MRLAAPWVAGVSQVTLFLAFQAPSRSAITGPLSTSVILSPPSGNSSI